MLRFVSVSLALVFGPLSASAMRITTNVHLLGWSEDGRSALLFEARFGPEGGGAFAYLVVSASAPTRSRFEYSSDFSPGDGSRPQRVSAAACRELVSALAALLQKKGFSGVSAQPAGCDGRRSSLIRIPDEQGAGPPSSSPREGWRLSREDEGVILSRPNGAKQVLEVKVQYPVGQLSPSERLLIVLARSSEDTLLAAVFASDESGAFRRVP
jgi:hypothetical protein